MEEDKSCFTTLLAGLTVSILILLILKTTTSRRRTRPRREAAAAEEEAIRTRVPLREWWYITSIITCRA